MFQNFDFHHRFEDKFSYATIYIHLRVKNHQKSLKIIKKIDFLKFYEEEDLCFRILIFITVVKINFHMLLYISTLGSKISKIIKNHQKY